MHPKFLTNLYRIHQIQNGRLSAIIYFHMAVIWSTVLDG